MFKYATERRKVLTGYLLEKVSKFLTIQVMRLGVVLFFIAAGLSAAVQFVPTDKIQPPVPTREFRGAWIATVNNIDWPSKPSLTSAQQQKELREIIERAAQLKLNALIFQVRPACDALYISRLEPWSEYLTGKMGKAPKPAWDPLAFAINEAHKRGLELHAWFNPFRARYKSSVGAASNSHISRKQPRLVKSYGGYQWLDPAEPAAQAHSLAVILDVAQRYAVDGVHLDDYFYPYQVRDSKGKLLDFPDDSSWKRYKGKMTRADWRRDNINRFLQRMYTEIKKTRPWIKVGISPFGIWRPGYPKTIKGLDAYDSLYADARKWLNNGWLDYCAPQLYWSIESPGQSYPKLLKWWAGENKKRRHLWIGNNSAKVNPWKADEIIKQIGLTRSERGSTGNIHWNVSALTKDRGGLATQLKKTTYSKPALVPASPWLDKIPPAKPQVDMKTSKNPGQLTLTWHNRTREPVARWVFQMRIKGKWSTMIFPAKQVSALMNVTGPSVPDAIALTAVDRAGNTSKPAALTTR